ncbi:Vacuolar protein-sorting-associated protein 36 [Eumeta japonica]|uniref:Vacuolar protein-sorting-associated protein 36 n=1 Tax=Eumeta variegata TaxID=151549 RepID=A0A4C1XI06_EUMVA|nr:Vacuolar protein-sorting-associated protein 36 [Eumeta japonica]
MLLEVDVGEHEIRLVNKLTEQHVNKDKIPKMKVSVAAQVFSQRVSAAMRFWQEKQGDISEDDTVRFKSYLMSLGIDDPVTRDAFDLTRILFRISSTDIGYDDSCADGGFILKSLALNQTIDDAGCVEFLVTRAVLTLANRLLKSVGAPMSLRKFPSGAYVLQLNTHHDEEVAKATNELLEANGFLTPVSLSQLANVSVLLARERLYTTERLGLACLYRRPSFYPNLFLTRIAKK